MRVAFKMTGLAILLFLLSGCATQSDHTLAPIKQKSDSALTVEEYAFAREIVRNEIPRLKDLVTSATVTVSNGKVLDSNTGYSCISGRLLHITLIGDFVHIAVSHPAPIPGAPQQDYTVRAEIIDADAKSGRPCLIGVQIGKVAPAPAAESLPLN